MAGYQKTDGTDFKSLSPSDHSALRMEYIAKKMSLWAQMTIGDGRGRTERKFRLFGDGGQARFEIHHGGLPTWDQVHSRLKELRKDDKRENASRYFAITCPPNSDPAAAPCEHVQ